MKTADYMRKLKEDIGVAVVATVNGKHLPESRYINIGMANDDGIFFMTSQKTDFYQQLITNPFVSITGMARKADEIEVLRIQGKVRAIGRDQLVEVLKNNPYVKDVYPDEDEREDIQVFQVYEGAGSYHHLQKHIQTDFTFGEV